MSVARSKQAVALLTATVFLSGTVTVCLHGPDDHQSTCGGHGHFHVGAGAFAAPDGLKDSECAHASHMPACDLHLEIDTSDLSDHAHHDAKSSSAAFHYNKSATSGPGGMDHHMCPCVSHIPCDAIADGQIPGGQIVAMRPSDRPIPMPSGFDEPPYRPPVC